MTYIKQKKDPWIFPVEKLKNSPSFCNGVSNDKELCYRQQNAHFIQEVGKKLRMTQLGINTAIVFMHRFYMIHSFNSHHRFFIPASCILLASKEEEQQRTLEHVLKECHSILNPGKPKLETSSQSYLKQSNDIVENELNVLETLCFDTVVEHPHKFVVNCTKMIKARREFAEMAYFMATTSLHYTPLCVLYEPVVVAAMCVYLSSKWANYKIPLSKDGKPFWKFMNPSITESVLTDVTAQFIEKLKNFPLTVNKIRSIFQSNLSVRGNIGSQVVVSSSNRASIRPLPTIAAAVQVPAACSSSEENYSRRMITSSTTIDP